MKTILADLAPRPGRLRDAVTIGAMCAAIVVVFMTLRIPEAGLGAYLVFLAYRADANGTIAVAVVFSLISVIVIALAVPLMALVVDHPLARMALVAGITLVGMWAASATALGPIAGTLAMLLTFLLILPDVADMPIPDEVDLLVRGSVWLVPLVMTPMVVVGLGAYLFGRNSVAVFSGRVKRRIDQAAERLEGRLDADAYADAVAAAPGAVAEMKPFVKLSAPRARFARLLALDAATLDLMLAVATLDEADVDPAVRSGLAARLRALPESASNATEPSPSAEPLAAAAHDSASAATAEIGELLSGGPVRRTPPAAEGGFLKPDALRDPRHRRFAMQVTIAAMACIAFFTGLQWVSIHTCLITCYYVSEATLGESLHKMTLRIAGALVGATIAVACLVFVIPRMDDVGQLAILVFLVATLGGWIGVGSERIAYAGFQITLAFFLVVLESFGTFGLNFGPSFDFGPATGRIIGILVGNLACAFVFLTLWPHPMRDDVARLLGETWERVADGLAGRGPVDPAALLLRVGRAFDLFDYVAFESVPPDRRLGPAWRRASDRTFRLVAVARCLARRRERLGPDGAPVDAGTVRAVAAGAAHLARREAEPPGLPQPAPAPPPADPLDRALLDRLREIACPSREADSSPPRSPACSPAA